MTTALVVHGHFYQPPRENPWTELVPVEPSAAPFHDWNARITAESYAPNGWARIFDEHGRVVAIVNNYERLSFNAGPTLLSWLEQHAPEVYARVLDADRRTGGGIAQAYNHMILPLASERDVRTQVRWGLADFAHRFGRPAEGMWLPETAVNDAVLGVLAEEGVRFTILAPGQARRVRPLGGDDDDWDDVGGSVDCRRAYRWLHPDGDGLGVDVVVYHGALSHDVAFGIGGFSSRALVERVRAAGSGLVCVAADGETFGHHHRFAERALAHALPVEAPRAGIEVTNAASHLRAHPPTWEIDVVESSWSCAHGVGRWSHDCGCSTGGPPGADQRWRAPLRAALDVLRDAGTEIFERRGGKVLHDPWAARDAYVDVVLGARTVDDLAEEHVVGGSADDDAVTEALTLLEAQRHALLMYTSCAWFFWDLAGLETVQCLRYAARCIDLLQELGEAPPVEGFLDALAEARSNQPAEGDGRQVWQRHVEPARVDDARVVAHLALVHLMERRPPSGHHGPFHVAAAEHSLDERGPLSLSSGVVTLVHARTRRRTRHAYAALHLGALEVFGALRPADDREDERALTSLRESFRAGDRVTVVLRELTTSFGPTEFGLESALPDAVHQIVAGVAGELADRFADAYARLFADHRGTLASLAGAGFPLPLELRAPAELVLTRRFEQEIAAQHGSTDPAAYADALAIAREAVEGGFRIDSPAASLALQRTLVHAVARAVATSDARAIDTAMALLDLGRHLGIPIDLGRAQDLVFERLVGGDAPPPLARLGEALGLAVDRLGVPAV